MVGSRSPPIATPLEPCRVAPYVSLAALRNSSVPPIPATATSANPAATGCASSGKVPVVSVDSPHPPAITRSAVKQFSSTVAAAAAFSAFDPAIISVAAHQVRTILTTT